MKHKLATLFGAVALVGVTAGPTSAVGTSIKPHDPPVMLGTAPPSGYDPTYNGRSDDPRYGDQPIERQNDGFEAPWFTLGVVGGVTFAGAALGITRRARRDRAHSAPHSA
jgi:hypothetical protein